MCQNVLSDKTPIITVQVDSDIFPAEAGVLI